MPMIDPRYLMQRGSQFYFGTNNPALGPMLEWGPKGPPFTCLGHFDEIGNSIKFWYAGRDSSPEEPYFVPRSADAPEGDGWIVQVCNRLDEARSDLLIFDALDIAKGPLATVHIPIRLRFGLHGNWVNGADIGLAA